MSAVPEPWPGWPRCVCGIEGCEGLKLTRVGHVVKCLCRSCQGRRSKRKGSGNQSRLLKMAAAAEGRPYTRYAPTHEEAARLLCHYEVKAGEQVTKALPALLRSWMKQSADFAMSQTPTKKWSVVLQPPRKEALILMPFKAWLDLVAEIQEMP